jgi:tetratricopeptide (TPR) repeat protein
MSKRDQSALGRRIRRLRKQRGLSQAALAEPLVTAAYISTLESGKRWPSNDVLEHLAGRLETTPDFLSTGRAPHLAARLELDIERARALVIRGDGESGFEKASRLADEARRADLPVLQGRAEEVVGRALLRLGRRGEALEAFRRASGVLGAEPIETRAAAVTGASRALFQLGDVHHSIHELQSYLMELRRRPTANPEAELLIYSALIGPCFEAGLLDEARQAAREVERLQSRVSDPDAQACAQLNLAGVYLSEDRVDDAMRALAKAETLFLQVGAVTDAAKADINQALAYIEQGQWEDARMRLKAALAVLYDAPAATDRARAMTQLGRVERLTGNVEEAIEHLREAEAALAPEELNERGLVQRELGLSHLALDDVAGERFLRHAIDTFTQAANPVEVGVTYLALADALSVGKEADPIAEMYREGLRQATAGAL